MLVQTLDVISVNIWQILISLINLLLLFLLVKKFLFKPIKKVLQKRQDEIDEQYKKAETAQAEADKSRDMWEEKLSGARAEADAILKNATLQAKHREETLIINAEQKAEAILRTAQNEAELERKKATEGIKREIVEVSSALTEKMLEREINSDDHRVLIDSFIEKIGEEDD